MCRQPGGTQNCSERTNPGRDGRWEKSRITSQIVKDVQLARRTKAEDPATVKRIAANQSLHRKLQRTNKKSLRYVKAI